MIFSTFFLKNLHIPYFIGISTTCCTTYFCLKTTFLPLNRLITTLFHFSYRHILAQNRPNSMHFCRYQQVLSIILLKILCLFKYLFEHFVICNWRITMLSKHQNQIHLQLGFYIITISPISVSRFIIHDVFNFCS